MASEKWLSDANAYPCRNCGHEYCYQNCKDFIEWLNNTVDAVEVVRCKACKYYGGVIFGYTCRFYSGPNTRIQMKENDFCSYGVMKDHDL